MAQVQNDYPDLSQMFGAQSVYPAILGMERFRQAQQAQRGNMAEQQQSMDISRQRAPADLEAVMSGNRHRDAQTRGLDATLGLTQQQAEKARLANEVEGSIPLQTRRDAALADYAAKISAKELADDEAKIKVLLRTNPAEGQRMWETLHQVKLKKMELDEQAAREKYAADQRRASAKDVAMIGASSRENVAATNVAGRLSAAQISAAQKSGKMSRDQAIVEYNKLAATETDPEKKALYQALADQMEVSKLKERQAAAGAVPQIDPNQLPGTPLTTPQPPVPTPRAGATSTPAAAPKVLTMADMKKRYPNATEEQIRAAAKAKGIELK